MSAQEARRQPLAEPSISPDRSEIAFIAGGDIWTVPPMGGTARMLVAHPATESRPRYSPDGKKLAFASTRTGGGDLYVADLATGELQRLTFSDAPEFPDGWSADSKYVYFSTTGTDIGSMNDILRVPAAGGTPMVYSGDRFASEYFAAPSPVAPGIIAMTAKGIVSLQWWRNGHSHIDESEIWLRHDGSPAPRYERLSTGGAKDVWPMWSADGKQIYFMSDRSGVENLWSRPAAPAGSPRQITRFSGGRVLWPSISYDGKTIVFERDFGIWSLDVASGKAAEVSITLRGIPAFPAPQRTKLTSGFSELVLSPDGKKLAFVARGDVYAAASKDAGLATPLTSTPGVERHLAWAPDSQRLVYSSDRDGAMRLYMYDFGKATETKISTGADFDQAPVWSPNGKSIAFLRGVDKLMVLDVASEIEREVAKQRNRPPPGTPSQAATWSPDSKWLAYPLRGTRMFWNVAVVPAAGGTPIQASFVANFMGGGLTWSPDGRSLFFQTGQRTESARIVRIDLVPRTPRFREDQFRSLFQDAVAPARLPAPAPAKTESSASGEVKVVAEGLRERMTILPGGVDAQELVISPGGKTLLIAGSAAGQINLWTWPLDDLAPGAPVARQLTSTPGGKSNMGFTPDGKEVFYLENGRINSISLGSRQARLVSVTAETTVDFAADRKEIAWETWSYLNNNLYDEKFHGADWNAIRSRVAPWVEGSRTPDELRRVLSLMIGELNASHTNIAPPQQPSQPTGTLGLRFDRTEYDRAGALRIGEVIRLSPADVAGLKAGAGRQRPPGPYWASAAWSGRRYCSQTSTPSPMRRISPRATAR